MPFGEGNTTVNGGDQSGRLSSQNDSGGGGNSFGTLLQGAGLAIPAIANWYRGMKNRNSQAEQNAKDRQFQWDMYWQQRADAKSDWAAQNEYNSPEQQMIRLKQAGLNPHLVYGKGADATADQIRSSQPGGGSQPAPKLENDFMSPAGNSMVQMMLVNAQLENMRAQTLNTQASTMGIFQKTARDKFDLEQADRLKDEVFHSQILQNNLVNAQEISTMHSNDRANQLQPLTIQKMANEILQQELQRTKTDAERREIEARIKNIQNDTELKELDIALKRNGIQPSDPIYMRILAQYLRGTTDIPTLLKMFK